ncbi:hypothetical protein B1992_10355 [Pseudoxanthomonas broegbernensis]|uniref:Tyr recombinase domain-containing protein n=1 Tax=Pseudoxanthomonas broegbernensis TaxID=83619 RepID=A0A7V8K6P4_9GAMM|nr:tyrosine-type recombinase/integrase [Pseudoxanthomonas broegbernensis]KAF1685867.1 hypothetical protein B1992_10355 [Pseudoxanthomonas broegbernensis]MBB6064086.1 integrase [Pseudoxanthomonas broegbernensis]
MSAVKKQGKQSAKKEKTRTVARNITERHIGTSRPYFEVRIRLGGRKAKPAEKRAGTIRKIFPYIPDTTSAKKLGKGKDRAGALADAKAFAGQKQQFLHYFDKPPEYVASQWILRDMLNAWVREACELHDAQGNPLPEGSLEPRKGAIQDAGQIRNLILRADEVAVSSNRPSVMDKKVSDLGMDDFVNPQYGLLPVLRGRKIKPTPEEVDRAKEVGETPAPRYKPAAAGTKRRILALLGCVWNHATLYWGMKKERPWQGYEIKSTSKPMTRALTRAEYEAVENAMSLLDTATWAGIQFLRWSGARKGEIAKLRWEHFTWPTAENGLKYPQVVFVGTKTPKRGAYRERTIQVLPIVEPILRRLYDPWYDLDQTPKEFQGKPWRYYVAKEKKLKGKKRPKLEPPPPTEGIVFPAPTNPSKPISGSTLYQAFVRAVKRAEVPHARLHDLRHTRTTEISAILPQGQAMEITGHSDVRTFARYTHLDPSTGARLEAADKDATTQRKSSTGKAKAAPKGAKELAALVKSMSKADRTALLTTLQILDDA